VKKIKANNRGTEIVVGISLTKKKCEDAYCKKRVPVEQAEAQDQRLHRVSGIREANNDSLGEIHADCPKHRNASNGYITSTDLLNENRENCIK
jgi:hypothetical protein